MIKSEKIEVSDALARFPTIVNLFGEPLQKQIEAFNAKVPSADSPAQICWSLKVTKAVGKQRPHAPILGALSLSQEAPPEYRRTATAFIHDLERNLAALKLAGKRLSHYKNMLTNPDGFLQLIAETGVQAGLLALGGDLDVHNPTGARSGKDFDVRLQVPDGLLLSDVKWVQNWLSRDHGEDVLTRLDDLLGPDLQHQITIRFREAIYREDDIIAAAEEILDAYEKAQVAGAQTPTTWTLSEHVFPESIIIDLGEPRSLLSLGMTVSGDKADRGAIAGNLRSAAQQIPTGAEPALRAPVIATNLAYHVHGHVLQQVLFGRDQHATAAKPHATVRGFPVFEGGEIEHQPGLFETNEPPGFEHINGVFYLGQWYQVMDQDRVARKRECRFLGRPGLSEELADLGKRVEAQLDKDEPLSIP
jgi:hypothetical protein